MYERSRSRCMPELKRILRRIIEKTRVTHSRLRGIYILYDKFYTLEGLLKFAKLPPVALSSPHDIPRYARATQVKNVWTPTRKVAHCSARKRRSRASRVTRICRRNYVIPEQPSIHPYIVSIQLASGPICFWIVGLDNWLCVHYAPLYTSPPPNRLSPSMPFLCWPLRAFRVRANYWIEAARRLAHKPWKSSSSATTSLCVYYILQSTREKTRFPRHGIPHSSRDCA